MNASRGAASGRPLQRRPSPRKVGLIPLIQRDDRLAHLVKDTSRAFLRALEELVACPLAMVSTGPGRHESLTGTGDQQQRQGYELGEVAVRADALVERLIAIVAEQDVVRDAAHDDPHGEQHVEEGEPGGVESGDGRERHADILSAERDRNSEGAPRSPSRRRFRPHRRHRHSKVTSGSGQVASAHRLLSMVALLPCCAQWSWATCLTADWHTCLGWVTVTNGPLTLTMAGGALAQPVVGGHRDRQVPCSCGLDNGASQGMFGVRFRGSSE